MKTAKITAILIALMTVVASPASAFAATLSLSPDNGTFNPGCTFSVDVKLDTQNVATDGTDVILLFDQTRLSVTSVDKGTIYPDYPSPGDAQDGKVSISGIASVDTPFTGTGTFATVHFQVSNTAPAGATSVTFDFDPNNPGKTTDSNVVQRGTTADVLNSVDNGNYTIGTGTCGNYPITNEPGGTGTTGTPSGTLGGPGIGGPVSTDSGSQLCNGQLCKSGNSQNTIILTVVGTVLTVLGIAGLAIL